jgi:hypothetical protein
MLVVTRRQQDEDGADRYSVVVGRDHKAAETVRERAFPRRSSRAQPERPRGEPPTRRAL